MNFQLLLQFPNNWTGSESKMMDSSTQYAKTLLEARLCRMASLDGESVLSLYWTDNPNSHEEVRAEILKLCQNYGIECIEHSSESTHVDLITQVFEKKPEWSHFMKLVAEDFLSPTDYAISCYREVASVKDIDYSFSVNETPGTEFEIYYRNIVEPLGQLEEGSNLLLKYRIAKLENEGFRRKRFLRKYINEFQPNFRFTVDSSSTFEALQNFLAKYPEQNLQNISQDELERFSVDQGAFLREFPQQFYDHRRDFGPEVEVPIKMQFLERGLVNKRYMKPGSRVLDLCSGDMYLPQICYLQSGCTIDCIDNSEASRKLHEDLKLESKGINLYDLSVLSDDSWEKIKEMGPYDVVTFCAAIEHFTLEEQDYIANKVSQVLIPGGVLAGDTILVPLQSLPGHWQHKNEFETENQLANIFEPYFSNVDVFVSHYKTLVDPPVYFICTK